jgi:hypothetical protein
VREDGPVKDEEQVNPILSSKQPLQLLPESQIEQDAETSAARRPPGPRAEQARRRK